MVVSVSGGSPRLLMSASRSDMIFLKVLKSSSPFFTDCVQAWNFALTMYQKGQQVNLRQQLRCGSTACLAGVASMQLQGVDTSAVQCSLYMLRLCSSTT